MKLTSRISLRFAMLLIVGIGLVLAVVRWNDPAVRYRRDHDQESLNTVMSRRASAGDTVETIEGLLGSGTPVKGDRYRKSVRAFVARAPSGFPDGIEDQDEFLSYPSGQGFSTILQFRRGRLINFKPSDYEGAAANFSGASR